MKSTYEILVEAMPVYQEQLRKWLAGEIDAAKEARNVG